MPITEIWNISENLCNKIHILSRDDSDLSTAYDIYCELNNISNLAEEDENKDKIKEIIRKEKKLINFSILIVFKYFDLRNEKSFSERKKNQIKTYIIQRFGKILDSNFSNELLSFDSRIPIKKGCNILFPKGMNSKAWFNSYGCFYPNLKRLYDILITIPTSSTYIERSFSIQAELQNCRRNRLNQKLVKNILRIKFKRYSDKIKENSCEEEVEIDNSEEEISDYEDYLPPLNNEENNVNEVDLTVDEDNNTTCEESLDDDDDEGEIDSDIENSYSPFY